MPSKTTPTGLLEKSPGPSSRTATSLRAKLDKRADRLLTEFQAVLGGKNAALRMEFAVRCASRVRGLIPSIGEIESPILIHSDEMVAAIDAAAWIGIEAIRDVGKRIHANQFQRMAKDVLGVILSRQSALFEDDDTATVYLETMRVGVKALESVFWYYEDKERPTNFAAVAAAHAVTATLSSRGGDDASLVEKALRKDLETIVSAQGEFGPLWPSAIPSWAVEAENGRPLTTLDDRFILLLVDLSNQQKKKDEGLKLPAVPDRDRALVLLREAHDLIRATATGDSEFGRTALDLVEGFARELRASVAPSAKRQASEPARVGHPLIEDLAKLWDDRETIARPELTRRFQQTLDSFHERETLGSFPLNTDATRWVNWISTKCRIHMMLDNDAVRIRCANQGKRDGYFIARYTVRLSSAVPGTGSNSFPKLTAVAY